MVVLRATRKLKTVLPDWSTECGASGTALGDWYVNRLVVDRQPLLLLLSAKSLLPIVTPARQVRTLPARLAGLVGDRLRRLGVSEGLVRAELAPMAETCVGPTADRSVMGTMVDFAKSIAFFLPVNGWNTAALPVVEARLAETPCRCSGRDADTIFPVEATYALLEKAWSDQTGEKPPSWPEATRSPSGDRLHHDFLLRRYHPEMVDPWAFSAVLVLSAVDDLRYTLADTGAVQDRLRALHRQLDGLDASEEVWYLRAVVNACEQVERDRTDRDVLLTALTSYSAWLRGCGQGAEAADVAETASAWNAA